MSASTTATAVTAPARVNTRVFWERLCRSSGIQFVVFFIIAHVIYGFQPQVGASADALFAAGVAAVVLVLLGGTTWLSGGFWAPDGAYSRFLSPIIGLVWPVVVSRVLLSRIPATRSGW